MADRGLFEVLTRVRRSTTNPDVLLVCDALEKYLGQGQRVKWDRNAYMRHYMRDWRAKRRKRQAAAQANNGPSG